MHYPTDAHRQHLQALDHDRSGSPAILLPQQPPYHAHHMPQLPPSPHHSAMPVSPSRKSFSSAIKHKSTNSASQHTGANHGYSNPNYRSSHHPGSDYYGSPPQYPSASTMSKIPTYQSQHRATIADATFSSPNRSYLKDSNPSPSLMQSMDAFSTPQASPRMAPKPPPRRREQPQPTADGSELPSLDQYEAMLQQMTSPAGSSKETRQRRTENVSDRNSRRMTRQGRKQQQQQQQQQQHSVSEELNSIAVSILLARSRTRIESLSERKHRRRSSMPTFGDFPIRALTELKRRSSEYRIPAGHPSSSAMAQGAGSLVEGSTESSMRSWEHNDSMKPPVKGLVNGREDPHNAGSTNRTSKRLSHSNVRSTRRLSHALAPPDMDYFTLQHSHAKPDFSLDEGDRRIEQYQMELRQLQGSGIKSPNMTPIRSRTTTDEVSSLPIPIPPPSRQQLLASLGDGTSSSATSPNRSVTPSSPKPRPTTPVRPAPPPGLSPMSITSAPIILSHGTSAPSPSNVHNHNKRNPPTAASAARRMKPASTTPASPAAPRSRAASTASMNSMNSMGSNFHMDGILNQAPPSLPLPSVPSSPASPVSISSTSMSISESCSTATNSSNNTVNNNSNNNNNNNNTHRRRKPSEAAAAAAAVPANGIFLPPSSQFMSAELEEMALLSSANSRTGLVAELEALKSQLAERDQTIHRLTVERQQEHALQQQPQQQQQQQHLRPLAREKEEEEIQSFQQQLSFQQSARAQLEASLAQSHQDRQSLEERYRQLEQAFQQLQLVVAGSRTQQEEEHQQQQRRQQEAEEHRALHETIQRLTAQLSELEDQHASEMQRLQRDQEELLETVVVKHAGALTDLSEQAKTDYEHRLVLVREELARQFRLDHEALLSKERVLQSRWEEQSRQGLLLQERLFQLEQAQSSHEEERETWRQTNQSLERQLAMEHLQQQENKYRIETLEKENRRWREILAELDLAAAVEAKDMNRPTHRTSPSEDQGGMEDENKVVARMGGGLLDVNHSTNDGNDNDNAERPSQAQIVAMYESQRQRWKDHTQLLERKMAKSEEEATAIMQKNMELMVALELAQSKVST
ncbi:unnamed protein product [Mortierella alpina]